MKIFAFGLLKWRTGRRAKPRPRWVVCTHCDLEILAEEADGPFEDGTYSHRGQSCSKPFYREREIGSIRKPPFLPRLPFWR